MAVEEWEAISSSSSELNNNMSGNETNASANLKLEEQGKPDKANKESPRFTSQNASKKEGLEVLRDMLDDLGQLFDEEGHRWKAPIKESLLGCIGCMERACEEARSLLKKARQQLEPLDRQAVDEADVLVTKANV